MCVCLCKHKELSQEEIMALEGQSSYRVLGALLCGSLEESYAPVVLSPKKIPSWQKIPCHVSTTRSGQGLLRIVRVPG